MNSHIHINNTHFDCAIGRDYAEQRAHAHARSAQRTRRGDRRAQGRAQQHSSNSLITTTITNDNAHTQALNLIWFKWILICKVAARTPRVACVAAREVAAHDGRQATTATTTTPVTAAASTTAAIATATAANERTGRVVRGRGAQSAQVSVRAPQSARRTS